VFSRRYKHREFSSPLFILLVPDTRVRVSSLFDLVNLATKQSRQWLSEQLHSADPTNILYEEMMSDYVSGPEDSELESLESGIDMAKMPPKHWRRWFSGRQT